MQKRNSAKELQKKENALTMALVALLLLSGFQTCVLVETHTLTARQACESSRSSDCPTSIWQSEGTAGKLMRRLPDVAIDFADSLKNAGAGLYRKVLGSDSEPV